MLILADIFGWLVAHLKPVLIVTAIIAILVSVALWSYCGDSRLEQRIEDRQPVIVEQQQGANQAINAAINANADAVAAQKAANAIRANKQTNVSVDEATKNLCIAYPELKQCK